MASKKELALVREEVLELLELRIPEYVFYRLVGVQGKNGKAESKAGYLRPDGYTVITINGNLFLAHRLVWFVIYGEFPKGNIDHVDGDPSNNRIENLRDVSCTVNNQNAAKYNRRDTNLPTGVAANRNKFDEITGYYAQWYDMSGKNCKTYFGIREWCTLGTALAAAITRRNLELASLSLLGAAYTERHGT